MSSPAIKVAQGAYPTHHVIVKALNEGIKNVNEISRRTKEKELAPILPKLLWEALRKEDYKFQPRNARRLIEMYISYFREPRFSTYIERLDQALQEAFELAVSKDASNPALRVGDTTPLRELIDYHWPLLAEMTHFSDLAGLRYEQIRFPLIAGWANVPLSSGSSREDDLRRALRGIEPCLRALKKYEDTERAADLRVRVSKANIAASQMLHLLQKKRHVPVLDVISRRKIISQRDQQLLFIQRVPSSHHLRWNWARDVVTLSSALQEKNPCAHGYAILMEARPEFDNVNYSAWTVGDPANDPDLAFFRKNYDEIHTMALTLKGGFK